MRDLGDLTLATLHVRGHEWSQHGKMVRVSNHASEAQALEAMGLWE